MHRVRQFTVLPKLPDRLLPLRDLAMNYWWCWNHEAQELFRRLAPEKWTLFEQNPLRVLNTIDQARLTKAASDTAFLAHLDTVMEALKSESTAETWFDRDFDDLKDTRVAYFSAEFGVHETLPTYSGGLGVLAGDHLKAASDLGIPVIGVTLFYQYGYFHQYLSKDGMQYEEYPPVEKSLVPARLVYGSDGEPVKVSVPIKDHEVTAQVWEARVGRLRLLLRWASSRRCATLTKGIARSWRSSGFDT